MFVIMQISIVGEPTVYPLHFFWVALLSLGEMSVAYKVVTETQTVAYADGSWDADDGSSTPSDDEPEACESPGPLFD